MQYSPQIRYRKPPAKKQRSSGQKKVIRVIKAHKDFVRNQDCCVEGCGRKPIHVHHIGHANGLKGGDLKVPDWQTVPLCWHHHMGELHPWGEIKFSKHYGIDLVDVADQLANASPARRKIEDAKQQMDDFYGRS